MDETTVKKKLKDMNNNKYKQEVIEFLGNEGLEYLKEYYDQDKLIIPWSSILYGRVGMQVRNHLRNKFPKIDTEIESYEEFEDWSWELINEIMTEYRKSKD